MVDPLGDHGLHGRRQERRRRKPRLLGGPVPEHPGRLDDEERVAPGVPRDPVGRCLVEAFAGLAGELERLVERHRLQVQVQRVASATAPVRMFVEQRVAGRAQDQHRDPLRVAHQPLDEFEHQRLGLMQVLEQHHDRAPSSEPLEEPEEAGADLGDAVAPGLVVRLLPDPEREAETGHDLLGLVFGAALGDDLLEPESELVLGGVRRFAHLVQEHLRERAERDVLVERARATDEHLGVVGQTGEELLRDAALADPRLAVQRDEVPAVGLARAVERVEQQPQLALAVHERDRAPRHAGLEPGDRIGPRGIVEALRLHLHDRPVLDLRLREPVARLGDEHAPGLGGLLQPRGEVHGGPVEQPLLGGFAADRDRPRVDPDPDAQGDREPVLLPELADAVDEREPGADGPERVVVVGVRDPEDPHHGVAGEVVRAAAERFELVGHDPVVAGKDVAVALGVDASRELGRADEIDEDDRDDLALLGRAGADGVPAVRAEAGLLREREPAPFTRRHRHGRESTDVW